MGLMRFIVSPPDRLPAEMLQQAYLSGLDRVPWEVHTRFADGELCLERASSDSGNLHIPWTVPGHGTLLLATGTLRECSKPYHLPLELARGKLGQVRNQLADWTQLGLDVPTAIPQMLKDAARSFGGAAVSDPTSPASVERAERVLKLALDVGVILTAAYAEQALAVRRRGLGRKLPTFLGATLGGSQLDDFTASQFTHAFNAACVPMNWRDVETNEEEFYWEVSDQHVAWSRERNLKVCAGPLLQLDGRSVPNWLHVCQDDFDCVRRFASEYVESAVRRYAGKVDLWLAAGRINTADGIGLTEEEQIRLTAQSVEITRELDPNAEIFVAVDQPWAEYLTEKGRDFSPIQFADALLRAELGLNGVLLEVNYGYFPGGTFPRDPVDVGQMVDYWSLLGVPLLLAVTVPSASNSDPLAQFQTSPLLGDWSTASQHAWISRYMPLILAKPAVQGVLWNQLRDAEPHAFAHGSLFDLRRHPKPGIRLLGSLRQAHLQ